MSIVEMIDKEEDKLGDVEYSTLQLDPYILMQLASELGYSDEEYVLDPHILETYKGYKIELLEDGPDTIRFI
jgi:hypothetical protein